MWAALGKIIPTGYEFNAVVVVGVLDQKSTCCAMGAHGRRLRAIRGFHGGWRTIEIGASGCVVWHGALVLAACNQWKWHGISRL